tara:strand:+ start:4284 stop:4430 length:147 start_codon:yes stop_codon:yes gene_type:complete
MMPANNAAIKPYAEATVEMVVMELVKKHKKNAINARGKLHRNFFVLDL